MDNELNNVQLLNHNIIIKDRKVIDISGIEKINSFDNEEFILETKLGVLGIKGKNLEIIKLDTTDGTISIKGIINNMIYFDSEKDKKENGIISKLFKWWI